MPIPILGKVSMHRGNVLSRKHNNRTFDKDKWNKDGHIDYSRTHLNDNVIDYDLAQYIDEIMGDATLENDEKNWIKHPERVIGMSKNEYGKTLQKMTEKKSVLVIHFYLLEFPSNRALNGGKPFLSRKTFLAGTKNS